MSSKGKHYSEAEDFLIVRNSEAGKTARDIAKLLGTRTQESIKQRRKDLRAKGLWAKHSLNANGASA